MPVGLAWAPEACGGLWQGQDLAAFQKQSLVTCGDPGPKLTTQSSEREPVMLSNSSKSSGKAGVTASGAAIPIKCLMKDILSPHLKSRFHIKIQIFGFSYDPATPGWLSCMMVRVWSCVGTAVQVGGVFLLCPTPHSSLLHPTCPSSCSCVPAAWAFGNLQVNYNAML